MLIERPPSINSESTDNFADVPVPIAVRLVRAKAGLAVRLASGVGPKMENSATPGSVRVMSSPSGFILRQARTK